MQLALRFAFLVGLSMAEVLAGPHASAMAAGHDGQWSVLIITEKGQCDRGYRYSVAVANGQVRYQGDTSVDLSGTVAPNGAVKVSIKFGGQGANGTGRLSGNTGGGTWHSIGGGDQDCSGRWEAERR